MANLAPTWRPKRLQNRGQNLKKSMSKNNTFLTSIFSRFGVIFGKLKTLKIELSPRREHNFWKIGLSLKYAKKHSILSTFWEAKILDFRIFFEKKRKPKTRWFLEGKKIAFWGLKSKLRTKCGGPCGSGGRNKRMGEGLWARNLKPNSESKP